MPHCIYSDSLVTAVHRAMWTALLLTLDNGGWKGNACEREEVLTSVLQKPRLTNEFESRSLCHADIEAHVYALIAAGLNNLVTLLTGRRYYLRIDLTDGSSEASLKYALYSNFQVGSAATNYELESVGAYCGTSSGTLGVIIIYCRVCNKCDLLQEMGPHGDIYFTGSICCNRSQIARSCDQCCP